MGRTAGATTARPRRWRWAVVALGTALLVATPFVVRAWPTPGSDLTAPEVVERLRAASGDDGPAWSGLVSSRGGVELPTDDSLSGVAKLLGRDGTLRVWWRDPDTWRVATLRTTGETDLVHRAGVTLRWVYESKNVTLFPDVPIRLPNSSDVLPPTLATRVLQGARPEEVSRLGTTRVAGRAAVGVRLTPADEQASIDHVDVWADLDTGVPLRVALFETPDGPSVLDTAFTDFSPGDPGEDVLGFAIPQDARTGYEETVDLAAAADRYADRVVPDTLAGLPRRATGVGSVGLYGRGPTVLMALPLRPDDAEQLVDEVRSRPGSVCTPRGISLRTGPLQLLVTDPDAYDPWVLAGTVTEDTVLQASRQLPSWLVTRTPNGMTPNPQEACR